MAADTSTPIPPRSASQIAHFDLEADVVVVGLGAAGAAAGIEAVRAGADTLVLERASRGGGTTALSSGILYFGGGTRVQRACGFEDSTQEMLRFLSFAGGTLADPEKIRLYCEGSLEHFEWIGNLGVEFKDSYCAEKTTQPDTDDCLLYSGNELVHPFSSHARPAPRGHKPRKEGDAGGLLMEVLMGALARAGARIVNDCHAQALVCDDSRRVVGVVARHEGAEIAVEARRGVVLAAGGFIKNREMVGRYAPSLLRCNYPLGCDGDDGTGIRMGLGAGGAAVNMSEGLVLNAYYPPGSHLKGVMVNARGERFINEDAYLGRTSDAILHGQDGRAWLVVDDEIYGRTVAFHKIAAVEESFAALERALDMPGGSLVATLERYNENATRGVDPDFHKAVEYLRPLSAPPYAALDCSVDRAIYGVFTLGGLDTRPTGEVLDAAGRVVPGLYAAGRNSAGLPREGRTYASGMSIGGASFFGRLAGRQAACSRK